MTVIGIAVEDLAALIRREVRAALEERQGPDLLTTEQAAARAGVTPKTIREWVGAGLPAKRRGRRLLIGSAALDAWGHGGAPSAAELAAGLTSRTS